jgi:ABC-type transport system involved in cytochrome c biogenesis ATPase subunit
MLTLRNIHIEAVNKTILSNISLSIFPATLVNFYGPNGIGKSLLLKAIATLDRPAEGSIYYNDHDISQHLIQYRDLVDYLGHENGLCFELTVFDNLMLWAKLAKRTETLAAIAHIYNLTPILITG